MGSVDSAVRLQSAGPAVASRGFSHCEARGSLPDQGSELCLLLRWVDSLLLSRQGGPKKCVFELWGLWWPWIRRQPAGTPGWPLSPWALGSLMRLPPDCSAYCLHGMWCRGHPVFYVFWLFDIWLSPKRLLLISSQFIEPTSGSRSLTAFSLHTCLYPRALLKKTTSGQKRTVLGKSRMVGDFCGNLEEIKIPFNYKRVKPTYSFAKSHTSRALVILIAPCGEGVLLFIAWLFFVLKVEYRAWILHIIYDFVIDISSPPAFSISSQLLLQNKKSVKTTTGCVRKSLVITRSHGPLW